MKLWEQEDEFLKNKVNVKLTNQWTCELGSIPRNERSWKY
jgi:hypothetical protein